MSTYLHLKRPLSLGMAAMRAVLRHLADKLLPDMTIAVQEWRDRRRQAEAALVTPFGFSLAGNQSMARGLFEREQGEVFLKYLNQASVCIDIGANIGFYTCFAAIKGAHTVAVEPLARNLHLLYRNLTANELTTVEVFPMGLASAPGIKTLYGENTGASFIRGWAGMPSGYHRVIPVTTLDTIAGMRFKDQQVFVKLDVEGCESEVLKGAQQLLHMAPPPFWLIEISLSENFPDGKNPHFEKTFEMFWGAGYQARVWDAGERLVKQKDGQRWCHNGQPDFGGNNYLFTK